MKFHAPAAAAFSLLLSLAAGCGCQRAESLDVIGDSAPAADIVLSVAERYCPRPIVGRLEWVVERPDPGLSGHCFWDNCGLDSWVQWNPALFSPGDGDATETALAHELGHYCLQSDDEDAVEGWARVVNKRARVEINPPKGTP